MYPKNDFFKNLKSVFKCIRKEIADPFYSNVGSGLAYYFLLSIAPIMISLSYVAGIFFSSSTVLINAVKEYLPIEIADTIISFVAPQSRVSGLAATLFFFVFTLYLASKGIYALIKVSDYAYGNFSTPKESSLPKRFAQRHIKAILLTIMMILIIVISLLFMVFGKIALSLYTLYQLLIYSLATAGIFLILMLFYSWMPTKRLPYKEVIPGALFGSSGVVLASLGFSVYLKYFFNSNAIYGALSGVVVLLLWFFLISHILVIGIMINKAYKKI